MGFVVLIKETLLAACKTLILLILICLFNDCRTTENPLKTLRFQGVFLCSFLCFPLCFPLSARHVFDKALHSGRAVLLHLFGYVAVDVKRERRRMMAKIALHGLDIVPGLQCCNGIAVPEIVQACVWHTDRGRDALKVVVERMRRQVGTNLIGEHIALILPKRAGL